jgi:citrate lyase subunit beta/citryl-CoA lyase
MIAFGSIDLALDLGCAHDQQALLAARSEIVRRSQAANRAAPLDGVTVNLDVQDAFETDARHSSALGFSGKMAIHPKQIMPIKKAFRPSDAAIA